MNVACVARFVLPDLLTKFEPARQMIGMRGRTDCRTEDRQDRRQTQVDDLSSRRHHLSRNFVVDREFHISAYDKFSKKHEVHMENFSYTHATRVVDDHVKMNF